LPSYSSELDHQPAVVAALPDGLDDVREVEVALPEWQEGEGILAEVLEVDVSYAIRVLADEGGRVAAAGCKMGGVGAEADAGQAHQPVQLVGVLDYRREVGMVAGGEPGSLGDVRDPVKGLAEALIVLVRRAGGAPGATSDNEALGPESRGELGGALDAVELVGQDVSVDEVRARIDAGEGDARLFEDAPELLGIVGVFGQVAVEHLHALVAGGRDVLDGLVHGPVGHVAEVFHAGHPYRVGRRRHPR
jgi:hypothetical protein